MINICFLSLCLFMLGAQLTACDRNDHHLVLHHRLFSQYLDKVKLQSYLSSFGDESVSASQQHRIYKRAPARMKKVKMNESKSKAATENVEAKIPKNVTITPKMIRFEIEDAKYSPEYEQLRKNRKLRTKRSTNSSSSSSSFRVPKEILKFSIADAVTSFPDTGNSSKKQKKDNKAKREIKSENYDSDSESSKSIKITHPLSSNRKNRYVTFDDLPAKLQKNIESAVADAQKKVPDGDYLKFYYGDRIIKIPQSMWKYITSSKVKADTQPVKFPTAQPEKKQEEAKEEKKKKIEYSEIFGTKTHYSTTYKPATIVEDAKSYMNFVTPKENIYYKTPEAEVYEPKKSFYFYAPPSTIATPPVSTYESSPIRETIPISEDIDEQHQSYVPVYQTIEHKPVMKSLPLPAPTSYVEFNDHKYANTHEEHEHKNYEFGYHVTDYKSGNNFGHTQSKKENVINGQYSILLPDGRIQITKYRADDDGFHADIEYRTVH